MISKFSFPIPVLFGLGAVEHLREEVAARGVRRPLVVSSRSMVETATWNRVLRGIPGCLTFTDLNCDPSEQNVMDGAEIFVMEGCDGLVAVGGGPVIDATKAIRLKVNHPLPLTEYAEQAAGGEQITAEMPPCIAVPTAGGRGSEVDDSAVIRAAKQQRLLTLRSEYLRPNSAVVDPELSIEVPQAETAAAGIESLTQTIESYLSTTFHPVCDAIALEGARTAFRQLPAAVAKGRNLEARNAMAMASVMAGIASQKGSGAARSMGLALSATAHMAHGAGAALMLPHVLRFNQEQAAQRIDVLARHLGVDDLAAAWKTLLREIGLEVHLRMTGIAESSIATMAETASRDGAQRSNPRPCSTEDFAAIYRAAW